MTILYIQQHCVYPALMSLSILFVLNFSFFFSKQDDNTVHPAAFCLPCPHGTYSTDYGFTFPPPFLRFFLAHLYIFAVCVYVCKCVCVCVCVCVYVCVCALVHHLFWFYTNPSPSSSLSLSLSLALSLSLIPSLSRSHAHELPLSLSGGAFCRVCPEVSVYWTCSLSLYYSLSGSAFCRVCPPVCTAGAEEGKYCITEVCQKTQKRPINQKKRPSKEAKETYRGGRRQVLHHKNKSSIHLCSLNLHVFFVHYTIPNILLHSLCCTKCCSLHIFTTHIYYKYFLYTLSLSLALSLSLSCTYTHAYT